MNISVRVVGSKLLMVTRGRQSPTRLYVGRVEQREVEDETAAVFLVKGTAGLKTTFLGLDVIEVDEYSHFRIE